MRAPFDIKHFPLLLKGRLYFPSKLWLQKQLSRHHKKGPEVTGRCRHPCWTPKEKYLHFIKIIPYLTKQLAQNINTLLTTQRRRSTFCTSMSFGPRRRELPLRLLLHSTARRSPSCLSSSGRRYLRSHQWRGGPTGADCKWCLFPMKAR